MKKVCVLLLLGWILVIGTGEIRAIYCPPDEGVDPFTSAADVTGEIYGFGTFSGTLAGPTVIKRSAPDPVTNIIDTEITSLVLSGTLSGMDVTLRAGVKEGVSPPSIGEIDCTTGDSFFDVFFELVTPYGLLHNKLPGAHVETNIPDIPPPPGTLYPGEPPVPLFNTQGEEVGVLTSYSHTVELPYIEPPIIPGLSPWGTLILISLLVALGVWMVMKKRKAIA